ncbi:MAG: riboflavin synthase [bacterium]|nr:riboflavin synthase [bacterium]
MFTGIVEDKGLIKAVKTSGSGLVLTVSTPIDLSGDKVGDSIAVNGICLTATGIDSAEFTAHVSAETVSRTNLAELSPGASINLERALKVGDRFGGHIVTGHIDGVARLKKMVRKGESIYMEVGAEPKLIKYIVEKGSIAIDGISLTVNSVEKDYFSLNIIPLTLKKTTLELKKVGDRLNIETDIIGKYVEKLLANKGNSTSIDMNLLRDCGFA